MRGCVTHICLPAHIGLPLGSTLWLHNLCLSSEMAMLAG